MVPLLALSLTDRVETYGAYVGVVAFFGLAVLTVLYFAQARELKRLREWAGRAPERAREAEERVVAQAEAARRDQAEPQAAGAEAAAPQPVAAGVAAATAAGVAGATTATPPAGGRAGEDPQATQEVDRVEGPVDSEGRGPATGAPGDNGAAAADEAPQAAAEPDATGEDEDEDAPVAEGEEPAGEDVADDDEEGESAAEDAEPVAAGESADAEAEARVAADEGPEPAEAGSGRAPATAAASAEPAAPSVPPPAAAPRPSNGSSSSPVRPGEIPPTTSVPRATPPQSPRPAPPPAAAPLRASGASSATFTARRPGGPGGRDPDAQSAAGDGRSPARAVALAGVAVVVAAGLVFAGTQVFGGSSDEAPEPNQAAQPTAQPADGGGTSGGGDSGDERPASTQPDRRGTRVAVLNGTFSAGLAGTTADKVTDRGYQRGTTGNFTDQNRSASVIYYADGARAEGRDVGRILRISDVQPMDSQTRQVGEGADIVVVTGSDQAP